MEAQVTWVENVGMVGQTGSGHALVMDAAPEAGGHNLGPRPMEMLLLGLGSCSTIDVVTILKKSGQPLRDCKVALRAQRATTDPKVFTHIHLEFTVCGEGLKPEKVAQAIKLSADKYCSASKMLGAVAEISHSYTVVA